VNGEKGNERKKPPPVPISVGNVNVIMADNTFKPRALCGEGCWTSSSPLGPDIKHQCKEVQNFFTATPPPSNHHHNYNHHHHQRHHQLSPSWPLIMSSTMSSHTELPTEASPVLVEMPASQHDQHDQPLIELDSEHESAFSTPCTVIDLSQVDSLDSLVSFDSLESVPELCLSPSTASESEMESIRILAASTSKAREPVKNGKLLSSMSVEELLTVLPELTPAEAQEFWLPLIIKEIYTLKYTIKTYEEAGNVGIGSPKVCYLTLNSCVISRIPRSILSLRAT
jgi:hypothetical protein